MGELGDGPYEPRYGMLIDGECSIMKYLIMVNLPKNEDGYARGNGEGVWVKVDEQTCRDNDDDKVGGLYYGELANNSIYYPDLVCGVTVPFEMRGENRPVVRHGWLVNNYGKSVL